MGLWGQGADLWTPFAEKYSSSVPLSCFRKAPKRLVPADYFDGVFMRFWFFSSVRVCESYERKIRDLKLIKILFYAGRIK